MDSARYDTLRTLMRTHLSEQDFALAEEALAFADERLEGRTRYDGTPLLDHAAAVAAIVLGEIGLGHNSTIAALLHDTVRIAHKELPEAEFLALTDRIGQRFGTAVTGITVGLCNISETKLKTDSKQADNFRDLLVAYSEDPRVILIKLADRLEVMRSLAIFPREKWRKKSWESLNLYAQIAHKLGLYNVKSELEDIALRYLEPQDWAHITEKLRESEEERRAFIARFLVPITERLDRLGIRYHVKSRTKSVFSIWNKMRKQHVPFEGVYDIFAIRIIIDCPPELEKQQCWTAYSVVTDFYTPNPKRMRDWVSIPKSNGYESLHATVMGPGNKWVEVQFRSRRMDLVAEKGLAAHWRYKGVKADNTDQWMNNIRDILESADSGPMRLMKNLNADPLGKEVFAFTPKGDLFRLTGGATVLDFAFHIHTNIGAHCTGAIVNGAHKRLNYKIQNGDTVEILTSANQQPRQEWLSIVNSTKARNKIKQSLNEEKQRLADIGKETLMRRAKNRKLELDDAVMMRLIKKLGYKFLLDFFSDMGEDKIDPGRFLDNYRDFITRDAGEEEKVSAEEFHLRTGPEEKQGADVLVIGEKSLNGLSYKFARCCNPIYGDGVFGFISSDGVVKIHKEGCPNADHIRARYPYRVIRADWSGKSGQTLPATLRVIGNDDIGIVANISSIISNENNVSLRNISIDSHDGIFQGYLVVGVTDNRQLTSLIKKIKTVKGVKDVQRT